MCQESKQKELKKFIADGKLHVYAVLETHLKTKSISKACDYVFGRWIWISNVTYSPTSCRIIVGWNADEIDIMVIQSCSQTILCLVEIIQTKVKFFVSFVYASNSCVEKRSLWKELLMHKHSVNQKAWVLMVDFNVTLKLEENSNGSSKMSIDMNDFRDAVNNMEVDDLCSTGITINEYFLLQFGKAHGVFLPYLVSDHSPSLMNIPKSISRPSATTAGQIPIQQAPSYSSSQAFKRTLQEIQYGNMDMGRSHLAENTDPSASSPLDSTGDLYPVTQQPSSTTTFALLSLSPTTWHRRLGHPSEDVLRRLESSHFISRYTKLPLALITLLHRSLLELSLALSIIFLVVSAQRSKSGCFCLSLNFRELLERRSLQHCNPGNDPIWFLHADPRDHIFAFESVFCAMFRGILPMDFSFSVSSLVLTAYTDADWAGCPVTRRNGWNHNVRGCHMYRVVQKLKLLKKPLNKLNWQNGNLFDKVNDLKEKFKDAQSKVDVDPFNLEKRKNAVSQMNEYSQVAEDELKILHQKAKMRWLEEGDKNTSYFHNIIKTRKHKSRIESICCEDGKRVEGNLVNEQFVNHFRKFLGSSFPVTSLRSKGDIVILKLSDAEANDMIKDVSDKEIKEALFDIDSSKAAGPDGYSLCIFKKAWNIIGTDVCLAVKEFFKNGKILGEINATLIALVSKMDTPNKVSDFRHVACCNVLYKCISKILTNRIKDGLSKVVSLNQSAFISGRHIQDNILITQELLKGYNRKNGPKRCAMKIDIQKAYDTINWDFLKDVMIMVGFHETMVKWIISCITSASFSICINGEVNGFFKGGKGLRQGDPISPYLFTLVMEVFNMIMIKKIREDGNFKNGCKEIKLTHMCFADDLMVLCNGDANSLKVILPFKRGNLPMRYLGVPLLAKRLGVKDFLSAMHQYWASVYIFHSTVITELEKSLKGFYGILVVLLKGKQKLLGNKRESLWVKWVNTVKLKGKSIWEAESTDNDSHSWKELMKIRDKIKPFVLFKVGNGKSISGWHDKCDGRWKWADEWSNMYHMLNQIVVPSLSMEEDRAQWLCEGNKAMNYSTKAAWLTMSDKWPSVEWLKVRTEDNLYDVIVGNITDMLKCLRVRKSKEVLNVAKQWNLKWEKEKLIAEI
ncbi:RNA-directed DNA polymerase, eukaryota, reverse transcriptase zinc-binding domain protein [Tanacetum coccineum]